MAHGAHAALTTEEDSTGKRFAEAEIEPAKHDKRAKVADFKEPSRKHPEIPLKMRTRADEDRSRNEYHEHNCADEPPKIDNSATHDDGPRIQDSNGPDQLIAIKGTAHGEANEPAQSSDLTGVDQPEDHSKRNKVDHERKDTSSDRCSEMGGTYTSQVFCKGNDFAPDETRHETENLSYYIHKAEVATYGNQSSSNTIFTQAMGAETVPKLRKDRINRIIVYAGCFNPPHLGHLELLCHTFFRSDCQTIAAMVLPMASRLGNKDSAQINGIPLKLSLAQRCALLEHPLLQRFAWVHQPGYTHDWELDRFQDALKAAAAGDGYTISFVSLNGPDHYESKIDRGSSFSRMNYGDTRLISSDISRESYLFNGVTSTVKPPILPDCGSWRVVPSHKCALVDCKVEYQECWPCLKFQKLGLHYAFLGSDAENNMFRELASSILSRCHSHGNSVWICDRLQWGGGEVLFFPCGRSTQYNLSEADLAISSSRIRKILSESTMDDVEDKLGDLALNGAKLLRFLGFSAVTDGAAESLHEEIEDWLEDAQTRIRAKRLEKTCSVQVVVD